MTGSLGSSDQDNAIIWCMRLSEGALTAAEQQDLRDWLAGDAARQEQLDLALAVWTGLEADAEAPELLGLRREALGAMHRAERRRWMRGAVLPAGWRALAAVVALVAVALATMVWQRHGGTSYRTGIGERRVIALADGSRLSLDADSAVSVAFSDQRRDLTLERGRARFKVAKNPLRPFAVHIGDDVVVATGTEFSVERLAGEMRVALFEGRVAVLHDGRHGPVAALTRREGAIVAAERALAPGSELRMPFGKTIGGIAPIGLNDGMEEGQMSFTAEALGVAAERMNRYAGAHRIAVAPDVAALRISGVFNAGDSDAFAQAIAATFPVRVTRDGDTLQIVAP